jgi:hypothetical protein
LTAIPTFVGARCTQWRDRMQARGKQEAARRDRKDCHLITFCVKVTVIRRELRARNEITCSALRRGGMSKTAEPTELYCLRSCPEPTSAP